MARVVHLCADIRGLLLRSKRELGTMFRHPDGQRMSWFEAHKELCNALAEGKKVIPCSKECEGFSYETGCPGHEVATATFDTKEGS